jgi:hypothetical protein
VFGSSGVGSFTAMRTKILAWHARKYSVCEPDQALEKLARLAKLRCNMCVAVIFAGQVFEFATKNGLLLRTQTERFLRRRRLRFALGLLWLLLLFPFVFVSHSALNLRGV